MLSLKELDAALAGNPFPAGNADPKSVHIGRSKMAAKIGKFIPAQMTGRNLRSVGKIAELARSLG